MGDALRTQEAVCLYLAHLVTKGRSVSTLRNYDQVLSVLDSTLYVDMWAGYDLEQLLHRPRVGRAAGRQAAPATIAKEVAIFTQFFGFLVKHGHLTENPAALLMAPKVRNKNPHPIPDDDWTSLWEAADNGPERRMLGLGFFAGLRRAEMTSLQWSQVNAQRGLLVGFTRKGGGDDVTPYDDLANILHDWAGAKGFISEMRYGSSYWDGTQRHYLTAVVPWTPSNLSKRMTLLCQVAEVPHYTPHQLRHSFVTNLLRCGVPLHLVQSMANHSNPTVTARYIKASANELKEWMNRD